MKIIKHIPNAITCLNLLCGTVSVLAAFQHEYKTAIILILAAAVFDFCDGFAARLLKAYSAIGKELDSLADLTSFGLAPAMILYNILEPVHGYISVISLFPLLIVLCSALRLAKFNVDERQAESFIGMPTPAAALFICSGIYYVSDNGPAMKYISESLWLIPLVSALISYLLVSEIKMLSLKFKSVNFYRNKARYIFILAAIVISAVVIPVSGSVFLAIFFIIAAYILFNAAMEIANLAKDKDPDPDSKPEMPDHADHVN